MKFAKNIVLLFTFTVLATFTLPDKELSSMYHEIAKLIESQAVFIATYVFLIGSGGAGPGMGSKPVTL